MNTKWQKVCVLTATALFVLIPMIQVVFDWPQIPKHRALNVDKYTERIILLKYFMSLGFTVIGATWYLVTANKNTMNKKTISIMSWSWTCLGVSMLSNIIEIYLTYKDFYYWPLILSDGYVSSLHKFKHILSIRMLHMTYKVTDYLFFAGCFLMIIALLDVLEFNERRKGDIGDEKEAKKRNTKKRDLAL